MAVFTKNNVSVPPAEALAQLQKKRDELLEQHRHDEVEQAAIARRLNTFNIEFRQLEDQIALASELLEKQHQQAQLSADQQRVCELVEKLNTHVAQTVAIYNELAGLSKSSPRADIRQIQPDKLPIALVKNDGSHLLICSFAHLQTEGKKLKETYGEGAVAKLLERAPKRFGS